MISVEETFDVDVIHSIIRSEEVYASMTDDESPKDPSVIDVSHLIGDFKFIKVTKDGKTVGIFMFKPHGCGIYEVHTMMTRDCRGIDAIKAGRLAEFLIFSSIDCVELTSYAWSDSPNVSFFAKACGFSKTGERKYETTRKGKEVNVIFYSLKKSDFQKTTPCQQSQH